MVCTPKGRALMPVMGVLKGFRQARLLVQPVASGAQILRIFRGHQWPLVIVWFGVLRGAMGKLPLLYLSLSFYFYYYNFF